MRRFIPTYIRGDWTIDIEGAQFSSGRVILEHHPYGGIAWYRTLSRMKDELNAVGETSIKWLDEEVNRVQS